MRASHLFFLRCAACIDRSRFRHLLARVIRGIGRVCGLEHALQRQLHALLELQPVQYGAATLLWLFCARWRLPIPRYSIHRMITITAARAAALRLCDHYLARSQNLWVARQRLLLDAASCDSPDAVAHARWELDRILSAALPCPAKPNAHFESGAATAALRDIATVFEGRGVRMFLVSGTLLGAVRDGRFVRSDYDIDVGYFAADAAPVEIARAITESGQFIHVNQNEFFISAEHTNGITIDVFAHFEEAGYFWHGSAQHRWYNSAFELEAIDFEGGRYLVPTDADGYLTENYGDWRVPTILWDVSFDTPNRVFPASLESLFMLLDYAALRDNRFRAQQALIALRDNFGIDYTRHLPHGAWLHASPSRKFPSTIVCGNFDPPDSDELRLIERAKELGGRVIVAVADNRVLERRLGRPAISDAAYRATFVRELRHVDDVFVDDGGGARREQVQREAGIRLLLPAGLEKEFAEYSSHIVVAATRPPPG